MEWVPLDKGPRSNFPWGNSTRGPKVWTLSEASYTGCERFRSEEFTGWIERAAVFNGSTEVVWFQPLIFSSEFIQRRIISKTKIITEHGGPLIRSPTLYFESSNVYSRPEEGLSRQISRNSAMKLWRYIKICHGYFFFIHIYRWYISYAVQTQFINRLREKAFRIESKIRLGLHINQNVTVHQDEDLFLYQQRQSIFTEVIIPTLDRDWLKSSGKRKNMVRNERRFILGRERPLHY